MTIAGIDLDKAPSVFVKAVLLPALAAAVVFFAAKVPAMERDVERAKSDIVEMRKEQLELMKVLYMALGDVTAYNRASGKLDAIQQAEADADEKEMRK